MLSANYSESTPMNQEHQGVIELKQLHLDQLRDGEEFIVGLSGRNVIVSKVRSADNGTLIELNNSHYFLSDKVLAVGKQLETSAGYWLGEITYLKTFEY